MRAAIGMFALAMLAGPGSLRLNAETQPWQSSWEKFLKAFQACLNDKSCNPARFGGMTCTWDGIFKSIESKKEGDKETWKVAIELAPGSMTDREGKTVEVMNHLLLDTVKPEGWKKLEAGEKVQFRFKNMSSPFGAGFIPLKSDCCFMVMADGNAELIVKSAVVPRD